MNILITGAAGFIGYSISKHLLELGYKVYGIDNYSPYYDVSLKKKRIRLLKKFKKFFFFKFDLVNKKKLFDSFNSKKIDYVVHLAAQPGVRISIEMPDDTIRNIQTFYNVLEFSRLKKIKHFLFASSSSVYGNTISFPMIECNSTDTPLSLYAATKKSNEVLAYSYSCSYSLPCTGMRFFTVYGPYGRPDMAIFKFVNSILTGKVIKLFNKGNHYRDFTFIDDVTEFMKLLLSKPSKSRIPFNIFNIGNGKSINLKQYIDEIQKILLKKGKFKNYLLQIGDVKKTHANIDKIIKYTNFKPKNDYKIGLEKYIIWFKSYYKID